MNSHDKLRNEIYNFDKVGRKSPEVIYVSAGFYQQLLYDCVGFVHMNLGDNDKPATFMGIKVFPVNSKHHPEISIR